MKIESWEGSGDYCVVDTHYTVLLCILYSIQQSPDVKQKIQKLTIVFNNLFLIRIFAQVQVSFFMKILALVVNERNSTTRINYKFEVS